MRVHHCSLKQGIKKTPEFAKKHLADYAVNVGIKCGHDCAYCSTGTMTRMHSSYKEAGENPFGCGYAIIDPDMPQKVAADAKRIKKGGVVQLCTIVDAWAPEAHALRLGRGCLEGILSNPCLTARTLTKNAAIVEDFDLIKKHRDRVLVGISLTGTSSVEGIIAAVEPSASPLSERFAAMREAHRLGLRTYAMLCPMLPSIASTPAQVEELVGFAAEIGAEEIFAEAVNARGAGLKLTQEALEKAGHTAEAAAIERIRHKENWSPYVADLIRNVQAAVRKRGMEDKLRFLLYPSGLTNEDIATIKKDETGVIWL